MARVLRVGRVSLERRGFAGVKIADSRSGSTLCIDVLSPTDCRFKLYTHTHPRHCPPVRPEDSISPAGPLKAEPGAILDLPPFTVRVVDAYNREDLGRTPRHKRGESVGYIVYLGDHRVYHVGDSDLIPEMASIRGEDVTVMLVPVGGGSVMNAEEAFEAVKTVRPSIAIPIHYDSPAQAEKFKLLSHLYTQVVLLEARV